MKIIDCFMYFDEDMMLDVRLNILDKFVTNFIICEASFNHRGVKKDLKFNINKFLKFNYQNLDIANCNFDLKSRFQIIFDITKSNNINSFDKYLENVKKEAKLENNFINLGIDINQDYSKIISGVNILRLSNNPIELNPLDLKNIIQS